MRNSYECIRVIEQSLFSAEERRLQKFEEDMLIKNREVKNQKMDGFSFAGKVFRPANFTRGRPTILSLDDTLYSEMELHIQDKDEVETDKRRIKMILFKLLEPCKFMDDVRDTLPECLVDTISELQHLSRTREPAYTIKDDPRSVKEYNDILPRMQFYSMARLMY